jgi:hypothetical protein
MEKIVIDFFDKAEEYNLELLKNMLKRNNQKKRLNKKLDIENITSKCDIRIKESCLSLPIGEKGYKFLPEGEFYRAIQYTLSRLGYLDEAKLYKSIADVQEGIDNERPDSTQEVLDFLNERKER